MSFDWSDENIERMKALWTEGLSASQIARKLGGGLSRSAVIGKWNRLGMRRPAGYGKATRDLQGVEHRVKRVRKPTNTTSEARAIRAAVANIRAYKPRPVPVVVDATHAKPWIERLFGECAFPISGEGADTVSCCAPTEATYCPAHRELMLSATQPKKRDTNRLARWAA